jgi:hypothetical protein
MHIGFWWEARRKGNIGIRRRRWDDNIKINCRQDGVVWTDFCLSYQDQWKGLQWASVTAAKQDVARDGYTGRVKFYATPYPENKCLLHYRV